MTEVPIWLKALKILAWPVTKLLTVMMKGRAHAQPEQIDIGVNDLEMVQLIANAQAGSHVEFENMNPLPILKTVSLRGA